MNYTFQSFNFRNRQGARPFFDLIANIAAEEFGHVELVCAAINTMLTGAAPKSKKAPAAALAGLKGAANPHHFLAGGLGALPQDSLGRPWSGDLRKSAGLPKEPTGKVANRPAGKRRARKPAARKR